MFLEYESQYQFVLHKSHIGWLRIENGLTQLKAGDSTRE